MSAHNVNNNYMGHIHGVGRNRVRHKYMRESMLQVILCPPQAPSESAKGPCVRSGDEDARSQIRRGRRTLRYGHHSLYAAIPLQFAAARGACFQMRADTGVPLGTQALGKSAVEISGQKANDSTAGHIFNLHTSIGRPSEIPHEGPICATQTPVPGFHPASCVGARSEPSPYPQKHPRPRRPLHKKALPGPARLRPLGRRRAPVPTLGAPLAEFQSWRTPRMEKCRYLQTRPNPPAALPRSRSGIPNDARTNSGNSNSRVPRWDTARSSPSSHDETPDCTGMPSKRLLV